jgi:beta-glucosidase-like glycosyl hydrolase
MAVAFVRGVQQHALANPKHYAANSIEDTRFQVNVTIDERTLREVYLPQFRAAVMEGKAASLMSAYNSVNGNRGRTTINRKLTLVCPCFTGRSQIDNLAPIAGKAVAYSRSGMNRYD